MSKEIDLNALLARDVPDIEVKEFRASRSEVHPLEECELSWDVARADGAPIARLALLGVGPTALDVPPKGSLTVQLARTSTFRLRLGDDGITSLSRPLTVNVERNACLRSEIAAATILLWIADPVRDALVASHSALSSVSPTHPFMEWAKTEVSLSAGSMVFIYRIVANVAAGMPVQGFTVIFQIVPGVDAATRTARYAIASQTNYWEAGTGGSSSAVPASELPTPVNAILDEAGGPDALRRILSDKLDIWFKLLSIKKPKLVLSAILAEDDALALVRCPAAPVRTLPRF